MKILNTYIANMKRLLKSPKIWGPFVLMPALMFLLFFFIFNGGSENHGTFGLVIEDTGNKSDEIVKLFGDDPIILKKEEALKELKKYNIKLVYLIDKNFSSDIENNIKPKVTKLFIEDSGYQIKDSFINDTITKLMEDNYLDKNNISTNYEKLNHSINIKVINNKTDIDFNSYIVILTICYTIVLLSGGIATDIVQISKNKVLSRILTSPNSNLSSISGLFLSYLTLLSLTFNIMAVIGYKMLDIEIPSAIYLIIAITSMVAFTLGLIMLIVRYTQNETILSVIPVISSLVMFLTEVAYVINKTSLPSIVGKLIFLNPLYWVQKTLESANLVNILPIILMSLVLLTFGSYKLEKLQNI